MITAHMIIGVIGEEKRISGGQLLDSRCEEAHD